MLLVQYIFDYYQDRRASGFELGEDGDGKRDYSRLLCWGFYYYSARIDWQWAQILPSCSS